ncbi:MAG: A/G-specific adenine glycosylase [Clostridia bacterium]|nr:A/G-specific adenine glycosylase [Clostridia bacterium]
MTSARDLPWRGETDPYRIWVSEIMLQQTTVQTVSGYYGRFLSAFPTVEALAAASEEDVYRLWQGLGYYSRARSLLACAQKVSGEMGGRFPETAEALEKLPGIGPYTAGAIASMAFGEPVLAMDGNLVRALSRLSAESGCVADTAVRKRLHAFGARLVDPDRPGEFNQAMMGLGRLVCLPKKPRCETCPVAGFCGALALGAQTRIPVLPARAEKRVVRRGVALVFCRESVLVRKRPDTGLLAGLWEFPGFEDACDTASVRACLAEMGMERLRSQGEAPSVKHVFTHVVWQMKGFAFEVGAPPDGLTFVTASELERLPMPSAMRAFRTFVLKALNGSAAPNQIR